jgi:hypothetical protein
MEPLHPASPGQLTNGQRAVLGEVTGQMADANFEKPILMAAIPQWIDNLASAFGRPEGYRALQHELRRWIYWTRVPGYWIGYLLQEYAKTHFIQDRFSASMLYAHAQETVGDDDKALATLELAYHDALLNQLPDELISAVVERLRIYHWYYTRWSQPRSLLGSNPLLEHPYHYRTWGSLRSAFPGLPTWPGQATVMQLTDVVAACQNAGMEYYLPVAHRWLATLLSDAGRAADAVDELQRGLDHAYQSHHDPEIGHLHRLRGETLGALARFAEAEQEHAAGLSHEYDRAMCSYWQALSGKYLGKVRVVRASLAGPDVARVAGRDMASFEEALDAFRTGRDAFDLHMMISHSPVIRASRQQLVRQISEAMIDEAANVGRIEDALAEIESLGPHGVADALAELSAFSGSDEAHQMQQSRAAFHRHLTTVPEQFDEYLAAIPAEFPIRNAYRATRTRPEVVPLVHMMLSSSKVAKQLLSLRVPDVSIALFHIGQFQGRILVVDLDDEPAPMWIRLNCTEEQLRDLYLTFRADLEAANMSPLGRGPAVDAMLTAVGALLGDSLAALAERVHGRHVKLFPRAQLSLLPLHAVPVGQDRLIDHSDVSYGQSLGLFTAHTRTPKPGGAVPVVLYDAAGTHFLGGAVRALADKYRASVVRDPDLDEALTAARDPAVQDLVFACHGEFRPDDPTASHLRIGGGLSFARLFGASALPNCRSVTLAACSTGLARAEIASESVGLAGVFLAAGARTVLASLWEVNEIATALLLDCYFAALVDSLTPARALNKAQRDLMRMPLADVRMWLEDYLPREAERIGRILPNLGDPPFAAPVHWAAFAATGEL